jgi:5-methylcytosine-specific restriction endonuclease McrA
MRHELSISTPSSDEDQVASRSQALLKKGITVPPVGQLAPQRVKVESSAFKRDPTVRAWVEQNANGTCELCGQPAPFPRPDGTSYLEVHHPWRLADGGPDTIQNAVALCPNCHRHLHHGQDLEALLVALRRRVTRLVLPR